MYSLVRKSEFCSFLFHFAPMRTSRGAFFLRMIRIIHIMPRNRQKIKQRKKRKAKRLPLLSLPAFPRRRRFLWGSFCFYSNDFTSVIGTAASASSMGQTGFAALRASYHTGDRKFPMGIASLVSSCLGYFSLRNSHRDTSLV